MPTTDSTMVSPRSELHFLERLDSLTADTPLSVLSKTTADLYSKTRECNTYVKSGFEAVEQLSTNPYVKVVDDFACNQLTSLETNVFPVVKEKVVEPVKATSEKVTTSVTTYSNAVNDFCEEKQLPTIQQLWADPIGETIAALERAFPEEEEEEEAKEEDALLKTEEKVAKKPVTTRLVAVSGRASRKATRAALASLSDLSLRSLDKLNEMTHCVDLIQYARTNIDSGVSKATTSFASVKVAVPTTVAEARERVATTYESAKGLVPTTVAAARERLATSTSALVDTLYTIPLLKTSLDFASAKLSSPTVAAATERVTAFTALFAATLLSFFGVKKESKSEYESSVEASDDEDAEEAPAASDGDADAGADSAASE